MEQLEMTQQKWQQFTLQDEKTQKSKLEETLRRAYLSPLYKKLWKPSLFTPDKLQTPTDLNLIPYLNRQVLFEATRTKQNKVCVGPVSHWFLGAPSDMHEWFPFSGEDFMGIAPMLARMSHTVGLKKGDIVLAVVDSPPRISSFIPYLWSYAAGGCELEFIVASLDWYDAMGMTWVNFIQKRQPTAIFSSTRNAQALAEKLVTMGSSVKDILSEIQVGIFYGEQAKGLTKHLEPYSDLETFEVYSSTEHMAFWSECRSHSGVHIWVDTCLPEVIPIGHKDAQLLSKAARGTKGELVITNFSKALPLIRYKTGNLVCVEGLDACACGCSHPRIRFCK